jgi:YfiH family protein
MLRVQFDDLVCYRSSLLEPLRHGVFTRLGGVSAAPFDSLNLGGNIGDDPAAVRTNHIRMYHALGVDDARACSVWQVHSAEVIHATAPHPDRRWLAQADALITDQPDLALSMRFADCTPILLYDPVRRAIGMAHAGWRGTVAGVAGATVRAMCAAFGSQPADIRAVIGPSISRDRYPVGEEVVAAAADHFAETDEMVRRDADGGLFFDLWAANRIDLERAGVRLIEVAGICTAANTHEFFSHRAEAGRTGRFGVVISL